MSQLTFLSNVIYSNGLIIVLPGTHLIIMALMLSASRTTLFGFLTLSLKTSKVIIIIKGVKYCIPCISCVVPTVSIIYPQSLQHWWQLWCGLLCQCVDQQHWLDVLAASCYLSQHLCHWDHLLPIWLSKLHTSIQVWYKSIILKYMYYIWMLTY